MCDDDDQSVRGLAGDSKVPTKVSVAEWGAAMLVVAISQLLEDRDEAAAFARRKRRNDSLLCAFDGGHRAPDEIPSIGCHFDELGSPVSVRHLATGQATPLQVSNHDADRRSIQRRQPTEANLIDRTRLGQCRQDRELKRGQIEIPAFLEKNRHRDLLTTPEEMTGHAANEIEHAVASHVRLFRLETWFSGMNFRVAGRVLRVHFDAPANPVLPYSHSSRS